MLSITAMFSSDMLYCCIIAPKLDVMISACRSIDSDLADNAHLNVSSHAKVEAARAIENP